MLGSEPRVLLSLFDGTGSICEPFVKAGWTVRRLDIDGQHGADIVVDIRKWNPATEWSGPPPDVIFAGPPCENYSRARTRAKTPRRLRLADSLVSKTIDIIAHFHELNPAMQYYVENPDSSMLWRRWVSHRLYRCIENHPKSVFVRLMKSDTNARSRVARIKTSAFRAACRDEHVVRLDYCQYRTKYRKRTRFMTNNPFRGLMCNKRCPSVKYGRHMEVAQRGPHIYRTGKMSTRGKREHTVDELHAYPRALVKAIFKHVNRSTLCGKRRGIGPVSPEPMLISHDAE